MTPNDFNSYKSDCGHPTGLIRNYRQPNLKGEKIMTEIKDINITEFIKINNLSIAKTQSEILQEIKADRGGLFDFTADVLIQFLDWESGKEFYKDEFVKEVNEGTKEKVNSLTLENGVKEFLDYLEFAWGKAEDQRGLSASRSIQKLSAYLWVFGKEDLKKTLNDDSLYNPYGAPALIKVSEALSINVPESLKEFALEKV